MSRNKQRLTDYLAHIIEAIERIDRYTDGMTKPEFLENPLVQDAVIRNLEIIGEASNNIEKHCPDFAANHQELPLSFAYHIAAGASRKNLSSRPPGYRGRTRCKRNCRHFCQP